MREILNTGKLRRLIRASLLLVFFVLISPLNNIAQEDSLLQELNSATQDTSRVNIMIELAKFYLSSDIDKTLEYASRANELSKSQKFTKGLANAYRYQGLGDYMKGDYAAAVDYWQQSVELFEEIGDKSNVARLYSNIGAVYFNQSDDIKALEFYLKSEKVAEEINDTLRMMAVMTNIGALYGSNELTYDKAIEFDERALAMGEKLKDNNTVGTLASNLGEIYMAQAEIIRDKAGRGEFQINKDEYEQAMKKAAEKDSLALAYFYESWTAFAGSENETYALRGIGKANMNQGKYDEALTNLTRAYALAKNLDAKMDMAQSKRAIGDVYLSMTNYDEALKYYHEALILAEELESKQDLMDLYVSLAESYSEKSEYKEAFKYQELLTDLRDTIYRVEMNQRLDGLLFERDMDKRQAELDLLDEKHERQKLEKHAFQAGLGFIVVIAFILLRMYFTKVRTNKLLDKQKDQIEALLLNTLPADIVKELNTKGESKPKDYQQVSVLFTDFKGFSSLASELTPHELIDELTMYFTAFDDIIGGFGLEKIKTIGDAYMCAAGVPKEDPDNAVKMVRAAIEIQDYMAKTKEQRIKAGLPPWELRVGIHTGPIVAGVVGKKKYAYDIWGDTVNVASRMESNGEAGRINISDATYNLVKHEFECEYRGKIMAKNIGEIDMYFVKNPIEHKSDIESHTELSSVISTENGNS
ncbi:MAG: tetratricopeptide repeat protein [Flavobacteriales bacterium]|nr:tetratricopeptide repeat protein [Flavobacteriales bacterium]